MIIKKISLKNIRSYKEQEINFSEGKSLLSGDIGAGKTTLLLALEFALFGLQKGIIEGNALLRNGEKEGKIELIFDINGTEYTVSRSLKRDSKGNISQENCFLGFNGVKKELSTKELKTFVIEILGYPSQLISKQNLVYRYTVYTPQEEMKKILIEDKEERIDTLRKVFDIDKYKRILNASEIFLLKLREKKKEREGQVFDLPIKEREISIKKEELSRVKEGFESANKILEGIEHELGEKRKLVEMKENEIKNVREIKEKISSIEFSLREKKNSIKEKTLEFSELELNIKTLKGQITQEEFKENIQDLEKIISDKEGELDHTEKKHRTLELNSAQIKSRREDLLGNLKNFSELKQCPVCKQEVDERHKEKISSEILEKVQGFSSALELNQKQINELQEKTDIIEKEIKILREKEKKFDLNKLKIQNIAEKEKRAAPLSEQINVLEKNIIEFEKQIIENSGKIGIFSELESELNKLKQEFREKEIIERRAVIEKTALSQRMIDLEKTIKDHESEIDKKRKILEKIQEIQKLQDFLSKGFFEIISNIEKQVMLKLSYEFNSLFRNWSSMLIENENMQARIDEEFSPMIEQAGHDISYKYLSGGERTALALAYRLALNQVINSMLTGIKTRELLILDEPTEGFSSKQLEKMRQVLNEIKANQLIIVSHESQIENFVEKIIYLKKEGHETQVTI